MTENLRGNIFFPLGLHAVWLLALLGTVTAAHSSGVPELYAGGRYAEARQELQNADPKGFRPGEEALWRSRLLTDPAQAEAHLKIALAQDQLDPVVRTELALELSDLLYGRGDYSGAVEALTPLLGDEAAEIPGRVHLRLGLALRALGRLQLAREMLASIRPQDPVFVAARYYLGDIGLEQDDPGLAARYFDSGRQYDDSGSYRPFLTSGLWHAKRAGNDPAGADEILARLEKDSADCLPLLEIRRTLRLEQEELGARDRRDDVAPIPGTLEGELPAGNFTVQLGAFSDRRLALEFRDRYRKSVPDLRIDQIRTNQGQFVYKVRSGMFADREGARRQADGLRDLLGIEVFVAELKPDAGTAE